MSCDDNHGPLSEMNPVQRGQLLSMAHQTGFPEPDGFNYRPRSPWPQCKSLAPEMLSIDRVLDTMMRPVSFVGKTTDRSSNSELRGGGAGCRVSCVVCDAKRALDRFSNPEFCSSLLVHFHFTCRQPLWRVKQML